MRVLAGICLSLALYFFCASGDRIKQLRMPMKIDNPNTETGVKWLKASVPNERMVVVAERPTARAVVLEWFLLSWKNNE